MVFQDPSKECYCAFCKAPRRVYSKKHVHFSDLILSLVLATLLSIVIWKAMDPRLIVFTILFLALGELLVQVRWRMAIVCPYCKFDPVVYIKNPALAAKNIKEYMDSKKEDSDYKILMKAKMRVPIIRTKKDPVTGKVVEHSIDPGL